MTILKHLCSNNVRACFIALACALVVACGDSSGSKEEQPAPVVKATKISFTEAKLDVKSTGKSTQTLLGLTPEKLSANDSSLSVDQFNAIAWSLAGKNSDLFKVEKSGGRVNVIFNPNNVDVTACDDSVCVADLIADLNGQKASFPIRVEIEPDAVVTPKSLVFTLAPVKKYVERSNTKKQVLVVVKAKDLTLDDKPLTEEQFNNLSWSILNDDSSGYDFFEISPADASVTVFFNADEKSLQGNVCDQNECRVTIKASLLENVSTKLNVAVTLKDTTVIPSISSIAIKATLGVVFSGLADNRVAKTLVSISPNNIVVNDETATPLQFAQASFNLSGNNAAAFKLVETATQVDVIFNPDAINIERNACADNICRADLTVSLGGKSVQQALSVDVSAAFVVNELVLANAQQSKTLPPSKRDVITVIGLQDILVNGSVATEGDLNAISWSLAGAQKDRFTFIKDASLKTVSLIFNPNSTSIDRNTCPNNICTAQLVATLAGKSASVNATVTLQYSDIGLKFSQANKNLSAEANEKKTIVFSNADVLVNEKAASPGEWTDLSFSLQGLNAGLFSINKTQTALELSFNKPAQAIERGTCVNNVCAATLSVQLDEKRAYIPIDVTLNYTVKNIGFVNPSRRTTVANDTRIEVAVLNASDLTVNGAAATAGDVSAMSFSLAGANADIFTLNRSGSTASLIFNADNAYIDRGRCDKNICRAEVKATLDGESATLNASVSLSYTVTSLVINNQVGNFFADSEQKQTLLSLTSSDLDVNGKTATSGDFKAIKWSLSGTDKNLFNLTTTDRNATLLFNQSQVNLPRGTCANNDCLIKLKAMLDSAMTELSISVRINYLPVKIKVSDLAVPSSFYFVMPGMAYCLDPIKTTAHARQRSGQQIYQYDCANYEDTNPSIPLALLLVRDDGQTMIDPNDPSINAYTASYEQRKAYLKRHALTAKELASLQVSIPGYASRINGNRVQRPGCQRLNGSRAPTAKECPLFVNKPNNPRKEPNNLINYSRYSYRGIGNRFTAGVQTSDYFSNSGTLATNLAYYQARYLDRKQVFCERYFVGQGLTSTAAQARCNTRIVRHAYQAHQEIFATRYEGVKQPVLGLNNMYRDDQLPETKFVWQALANQDTADINQPVDDHLDSNQPYDVSGTEEDGDRLANTLYPLEVDIKGANTLRLDIGLLAIRNVLQFKNQDAQQGLEKDQSENPLVWWPCPDNSKGQPSPLRDIRSDLNYVCEPYGVQQDTARSSFPVYKRYYP